MNENNVENKQLEDLLRKTHLHEPSFELKERITAEAKKAWIQTQSELPWQVPVRRLIVSAAAAVLIIWLANSSSDYLMVQWQLSETRIANEQGSDHDIFTEIPYSPLARHLVLAGRKPSLIGASALRSYAETMFQILDEAKQNGTSKPVAPFEGRSYLFPKQSGLDSYS